MRTHQGAKSHDIQPVRQGDSHYLADSGKKMCTMRTTVKIHWPRTKYTVMHVSCQAIVARTTHLSLGGESAFGQFALPPQPLHSPLVTGNVHTIFPFELSPMRVEYAEESEESKTLTCDGEYKLHSRGLKVSYLVTPAPELQTMTSNTFEHI